MLTISGAADAVLLAHGRMLKAHCISERITRYFFLHLQQSTVMVLEISVSKKENIQ